MEIIMPQKEKKAVHPTLIIKESWFIFCKNLSKLSAIYLIFNLPIVGLYLTPMGHKLQDKKLDLVNFICVFLPVLALSFWCHISLLLGAKKAADSQDYTISQSIKNAGPLFFNYVGINLITALFFMSLIMVGGISLAAGFPLLLKVNKILAISVSLVILILDVGCFVYFMLRWSIGPAVCVLENTRPVASLKRSLSLVNEYVHPLAGVYCLFMLVYIACLAVFIIIGALLGVGENAGQTNWVGMALGTLINTLLLPLGTVITVVLYKKLKEASEIHVCA